VRVKVSAAPEPLTVTLSPELSGDVESFGTSIVEPPAVVTVVVPTIVCRSPRSRLS